MARSYSVSALSLIRGIDDDPLDLRHRDGLPLASRARQLGASTEYPATAALEEELQQAVGAAANVLTSFALVEADRFFDTFDCSTAGLSLKHVGSEFSESS